MYIVLIYRPEVDDGPNEQHSEDPFNGIEIGFVTNISEEACNTWIDVQMEQHPDWKYDINPV